MNLGIYHCAQYGSAVTHQRRVAFLGAITMQVFQTQLAVAVASINASWLELPILDHSKATPLLVEPSVLVRITRIRIATGDAASRGLAGATCQEARSIPVGIGVGIQRAIGLDVLLHDGSAPVGAVVAGTVALGAGGDHAELRLPSVDAAPREKILSMISVRCVTSSPGLFALK